MCLSFPAPITALATPGSTHRDAAHALRAVERCERSAAASATALPLKCFERNQRASRQQNVVDSCPRVAGPGAVFAQYRGPQPGYGGPQPPRHAPAPQPPAAPPQAGQPAAPAPAAQPAAPAPAALQPQSVWQGRVMLVRGGIRVNRGRPAPSDCAALFRAWRLACVRGAGRQAAPVARPRAVAFDLALRPRRRARWPRARPTCRCLTRAAWCT